MYEIHVYDTALGTHKAVRVAYGGSFDDLFAGVAVSLTARGIESGPSIDPGASRLVESPGQQNRVVHWDELRRAVSELEDTSEELSASVELLRSAING